MVKETLRVYLEPDILATARAGQFNVMNKIKSAAEQIGWRLEWRDEADFSPARGGFALRHLPPVKGPHVRSLRRAYHYPFWSIEPTHERWDFRVARSRFDPAALDGDAARGFLERLRGRVLPGAKITAGEHVLIALQGRISEHRSFQSMSPLAMVETIAQTGRPCVATLHPREYYAPEDLEALHALGARFANLSIGGDTSAILQSCAAVATMNSAVAFNGYILEKPALLFAKIDFHHIALRPDQITQAPAHSPDFARYLFWFLREMSLNAAAPDIETQIIAAWRRGGWPV
ncbi:MAG: hypothetical protein P3W90_002360 [Paracoccus sp. (in: a-proteobacteria)]|nr:hypothetical protein [Paracoccus sp. (in: a-proteobacteria)]